MKYRLVIFDFDGTLADTAEWMSTVLQRAAVRFKFRQTTRAEVQMLRGLPNKEILRYLGVPLWKLPSIAIWARQVSANEAAHTKLFAPIRKVLSDLRSAGILLGVVTSNSEENVRRVLGAETASQIGFYECGASLFGKAARIRAIVRKSGIAPSETLAIGDESRDMDAAKAAGVAAGAAGWGYATEDLLRSCEPQEFFRSPEEIPARLIKTR